MKLEGIHHITAVTADAPSNADFYVRVLGLRIVKKTINQTDRTTYHIFYGDEQASYGNNISFFEYRGRPHGRAGAGNVHTIVWRVGEEAALDFWERRLAGEGIDAVPLRARARLRRPRGARAPAAGGGDARRGADGGVARRARRVRAAGVRRRPRLRHRRGRQRRLPDRHARDGAARRGSLGSTREAPRWLVPARPRPAQKRSFGGGVVQHIAWGCLPEDIDAWSGRVDPLCPDATGIIDRHFFRSTYFTEPGGVLFEIAEHGGPGFSIGEPDMQRMGDELSLPPWLEERRKLYEWSLTPVPTTAELRAGLAVRG